MPHSNTSPPSNEPPQESPMPIDPKQDPPAPEDPQRTDPVGTPPPPEIPEPDSAPENPIDDPFDEGNFPV